MMKTLLHFCRIFLILVACFVAFGCKEKNKKVKIGVSFGVGFAERWEKEKVFMEQQAHKLGANIEVRINRQNVSSQNKDCIEMIDGGIDVLIYTPKDIDNIKPVLSYAKSKGVKVVGYARVVLDPPVDLFVGYDSEQMGQKMGQFFTDMVYKGDIILLSGDEEDTNGKMLRDGAMRYIDPMRENFNIILESFVDNWSPVVAKQMVKDAISGNGNKIDGIFAPNDKIAAACIETVKELGIDKHVVVTGMDAELDAVRRIANGKQEMTLYMDLQSLAKTAVSEAVHLAKDEKVNTNSEFVMPNGATVRANLITGSVVTKENIDNILIKPGFYTREQIYGDNKGS